MTTKNTKRLNSGWKGHGVYKLGAELVASTYLELKVSDDTGKETVITIEPRPHYCDRGNYVAKIFSNETHIDGADMWPRYYFDIDAAKSECEAFLKKRNMF